MTAPAWKPLLDRAAAIAVAHLESLPSRPIPPAADAATLLRSIDRPVPDGPTPAERVLDELAAGAAPGLMAMASPRFFGWVIGGLLPATVAADWLTTAWDQNSGSAEATPASAAFEQVAIRWALELLDLPRDASAAVVTGAQMANFVGLAVARGHVLRAVGWDVEGDGLVGAPPVSVVVGEERHDTVDRALRYLGLGDRRAIVVESDAGGRMRAGALARALAERAGPTIVVAQAGNVNGGGVDPLDAIADEVDRLRARLPEGAAWLHVDGAFGLWGRAATSRRAHLAGAERADSWATDAHKWLNTPYDCGLAITRHPASHRRALGIHAAYLPSADETEVRTPFDYTPELSRRARGFVLWAALRQLGRRGLEELVERCCALARRFAERLASHPGVEIRGEVVLNQVVVAFRDPRGVDDDAHTRAVVERVQREGTCFVSGTTWKGRAGMRISVSGASTESEDVDRSVDAILRAHGG